MGRTPSFPPRLTRKPGTSEARTCYRGKYYTCGKWDLTTNRPSEDALAKWGRLVSLWAADPDAIPTMGSSDIGDVIVDWLESEDSPVDRASRNATALAVELLAEWRPEGVAADKFGVLELRDWQSWLCSIPPKGGGEGTRYGRRSVKRFVSILRQAVKWAWPVGLHGITAAQYLSLEAVPYPKPGKVREPVELQPVEWSDLAKVCEHCYPHVRAILLTLWWTGARTDELLGLKLGPLPPDYTGPEDGKEYLLQSGTLRIAKTAPLELGEVWAAHVVSKVRKRVRAIVFGPQAQAALHPILGTTEPGQYLFRPFNGRPKKPGAPKRKSRAVEGCRPGRERYQVDTLDHAITTACKKAKVVKFRAYQLRHSASQRIQGDMGREAEMAMLGHGSGITRHYGGWDSTLAAKVAAKCG